MSEESGKSIIIGRQEGIHHFGNACGFRGGDEKEQDGKDGKSQGDEIGFAFARYFIITEEAEPQNTEDGNNQTGKGENAEENIGHKESDVENRKEDKGQVVGDGSGIDMAAHIIQPVGHVDSKESQGNTGKKDYLIPDGGETVSVLPQPQHEGAQQKCHSAADDVVKGGGNEFHCYHGKSGNERT